jgi:hypothetical protein
MDFPEMLRGQLYFLYVDVLTAQETYMDFRELLRG